MSRLTFALALAVAALLGFGRHASVRAAEGSEKKKAATRPVAGQESADKKARQQRAAASSQAHPITEEDAANDPDLPSFLHGQMDYAEYLRQRGAAIDERRGLPFALTKDHPENPRVKAMKLMDQQFQLRLQETPAGGPPPATWTEIGPAPIPGGQTTGVRVPVSGRTTAIAIKPTDPNVVYVGTAQGGVYRTTDGGATWIAIFDSAQSLAVGALALAPSDSSLLYVGTGEPNLSGDSFFGVGVYRVENAETSPTLVGPINPQISLGSTPTVTNCFTGRAVSKILVNPSNAAEIWVSTASGIGGVGATAPPQTVPPLAERGLYHSTNATNADPTTVTFTKQTVTSAGSGLILGDTSGNRSIMDLLFEPGSAPSTIYATVLGASTAANDGGIYKSTDGGGTFSQVAQITSAGGIRINLAGNKVGSQVTLVAATGEPPTAPPCSTARQGLIRKSTDNGATWPIQGTSTTGGKGFCGGQCFYDMPIEIDPANANNIFIGGAGNSGTTCPAVTYAHSTNGGSTFARDDVGIHADAHAIAVAPSNSNIVYEGNDGGIWKSTDGGFTWTSLNNSGFSATQFVSIAQHPVDREFMIGGTQDNGTELRQPDGSWIHSQDGDGGYALIDQNATDTDNVTMYHTFFNQTNAMGYDRVTQTADAVPGGWPFFGCGFVAGTNGLNCSGANAATAILFYAPMTLGPGNPQTVYFGSDRLFRSTDQGTTMQMVGTGAANAPLQTGVAISTIGISPFDDNIRIVGMRFGRIFATHNGATVLTDITGNWPTGNVQPRPFVSKVIFDPTDATSNTAYATFATYCQSATIPPGGACAQVWKTTNFFSSLSAAGVPTWTPANGSGVTGIPDVPVSAFVVDPRNGNNLFAGTDIAVYNSTDGGATWAPYGVGFPRVAVFQMVLQPATGLLRVATHGRGIWEIKAGNATPSFSNLDGPTIAEGTATTLVGGTIKAGSLIPPGSVSVTINGDTQLAAIDPASGFFTATFNTSALTAAGSPYTITYFFPGDADYNPATDTSKTLTVSNTLIPTSLAISAPTVDFPNGSVTVTVSGSPTPSGNVSLIVDGGAAIVQALDGSGQSVFALPSAAVGSHSLRATYASQGSFGYSSNTGTLTITKGTPIFTAPLDATIGLGLSPSSLPNGKLLPDGPVIANVTLPTGSVDVTIGATTLSGAIDPASGRFFARFDTSALAVGTYPISYSYAGDGNFNGASGGGTLTVIKSLSTTFSNTASISLPDVAVAVPYPATITASNVFGNVLRARVTLSGVNHTFFGDTSFLLVGPGGQTTVLARHAGGSGPGATAGANYVFDDAGAVMVSTASGTYRPTVGATILDFPSPAPTRPYDLTLFSQNGGTPNGTWSLYAYDDATNDFGAVTGGWALTLDSDIRPTSTSLVSSANPGRSPFTFTATVSDTSGVPGAAPTGTVTFNDNGTPIGTSPLSGSVATLDATLDAGTAHLVTAVYNGDATHDVSTSNTVNQVVDAPTISINDVAVTEGNSGTTNATFTVTLSGPSALTVTVNAATASGTATSGSDFTATGQTLSFPPGTTSLPFAVPVIGDTINEPNETFSVNLNSPTNATLLFSQGQGMIVNDDAPPPSITISDVSVAEGNSGTTNADFVVSLSNAPSTGQSVTVNFASANGTATAGSDYVANSGSLTFGPGQSNATVTFVVNGDATFEADETFFVNLSGAVGGSISDSQGVGTILNDDNAPPTISITDVTVTEGNSGTSTATFTVNLSNAPSAGQSVTVNFATANGSASAGSDYVSNSGSLSFGPGQSTNTIGVLVNGDGIFESDETFFVNLSGAVGGSISDSQGVGTILNDDGQPSITIADVSLAEGNSGTTNAVFTLTLSAASGSDVTVNFATADGTAHAPTDYTTTAGTATISAGDTFTTFTIPVVGDTRLEPNEYFWVNLSGAVGATIADSQAKGTIINDDGPQPTLTINNVTAPEGNSGQTPFVFTVTLSAVSAVDVTVDFATANASAHAGSDYVATSGQLTIPAGSLTGTITVQVNGDTVRERNESFFVRLSNAANARIVRASGTGTITNDD